MWNEHTIYCYCPFTYALIIAQMFPRVNQNF